MVVCCCMVCGCLMCVVCVCGVCVCVCVCVMCVVCACVRERELGACSVYKIHDTLLRIHAPFTIASLTCCTLTTFLITWLD